LEKNPLLYQTHVQVHLDHIRANIEGIRRRVGFERKILIAVKANAYGHGAVEVSRMAAEIGVDFLGIATVPEAMQLRQAGISLPILKFGPTFFEEIEATIQNNVTLPICGTESALETQQVSAKLNRKSPVHIKIDTGMGRVGVAANQAINLARLVERECPNLYLEGAFTHLPVSDSADQTFTIEQVKRFRMCVDGIERGIGRKLDLVHCANSGAVLGHPEAWMDMVRPGIMIYGYYPDKTTPRTIALKPGLSFLTRVSFVKKVTKGDSIGYGRTWFAPADTWIATIPVGYADGFNRLFSNSGRVLINGESHPIVGRVCMDQSMVDLGLETQVKVGDPVVLIGKNGHNEITCDEWAEKLRTITYEITCQINPRVTRVFTSL
jgi:alanine racemase